MEKSEYTAAFNKIKTYIHNGDCYQANLAQRFSASYTGSPWHAYQQCREQNPAPFSAYLQLPQVEILSCSPERFLQVRDNTVETKPIKGTRPRGKTLADDQALANELKNSDKDKAENLMIVDLMRNDLGKNCEFGSIEVTKLFHLESFTAVHHLVSTVKGKLANNKTPLDLLRGAFPGGSITGAPKIRAMEIIEECEPHRRNLYCGSIGYISFNGQMDTNISIRTLTCHNHQIYCAAGGALVADSTLESEYQETFDKVQKIMSILSSNASTIKEN